MFELLRRHPVPALRVVLEEYRHLATGARHLHLATEDPHNAFLVGFLTIPQDSTGVAHILEHTSLCGSARFPVRDPFFLMTRRSLSTFMNAFTASDWTAYPFASLNRKDFANLLEVYLDAAFFPLLDPLDFAQEGWRVEFGEPNNPATPLVYKGVVFNEMKGAMSPAPRATAQALYSALYPTTTYHYNSGGEPADIPKLTYAQLKAFHQRHYHPSNALFMTYGNIPAAELQAEFECRVLQHFTAQPLDLRIGDERRYPAPITVTGTYAAQTADVQGQTSILLAWLLGYGGALENLLEAYLLNAVLLDNSASPLRHALETTALGSAPSSLCGLDSEMREMAFTVGLEGSDPQQAEAVEALILDTLTQVAEHGVPQAELESVLHQLELNQREITGDGFPYGLKLLVNLLAPVLHGGDAVALLDLDAALDTLRNRIQDPVYVPGLVRRLLLDNPHRVRLVMQPDPQLAARRQQAEQAELARLQAQLTPEAAQALVTQAAVLQQRQQTPPDAEVLPKVGIEDIPAHLAIAEGENLLLPIGPATFYPQGTNGLVYQQLIVPLPLLTPEELDLLPLYVNLLPEVGANGHDYLALQRQQAAVSGGISASLSVRGGIEDARAVQGFLVLAGKALTRNQAALTDLLALIAQAARFDEYPRLRELIAQERLHQEESVTQAGHQLAMLAAASGLGPYPALMQRWRGLTGLQALKQLDKTLDTQARLEQFGTRLAALHVKLWAGNRRYLLVAEATQRELLTAELLRAWPVATNTAAPVFQVPQPAPALSSAVGWAINSSVNFCAQAYPVVPAAHPDAPAFRVLAHYLRNGFLHTALREQGGAYGGGASFDPLAGTFRFYSYRDPRLAETFADFERSLDWLQQGDHPARWLEEAILGVISDIDQPGSPAGEALSAYFNALHGRSPEHRRQSRQAVLAVSRADLQRVAATWLQPAQASRAVLGSQETLARSGLNLRMQTLG